MGHTAAARASKVVAYPIVRRADGTVRQVVVVEDGQMTFCGYYAPSALCWAASDPPVDLAPLVEHRRYHWADAFTDAELADGFKLEPEAIVNARAESEIANAICLLMHKESAK